MFSLGGRLPLLQRLPSLCPGWRPRMKAAVHVQILTFLAPSSENHLLDDVFGFRKMRPKPQEKRKAVVLYLKRTTPACLWRLGEFHCDFESCKIPPSDAVS